MSNSSAAPRLCDVRNTCRSIRANWTSAKRRERRQLAKTRQRQLLGWMAGGVRTRASNVKAPLETRPDRTAYDVPLTKREHQVVRNLTHGLSNREIAECLDISIDTVKEHMQNVRRKLNLSDRTAVAVWAVKKGLV
jgi:DNA-binding NarL/FixJ family response regulator